jgi:hypothetical protein
MVKAAQKSNKESDLDAVFCSELVAAAFMKLGVLSSSGLSAANYTPKDFTRDGVELLDGGAALASIIESRRNVSLPLLTQTLFKQL